MIKRRRSHVTERGIKLSEFFMIDGAMLPVPDSGIPHTVQSMQNEGYRDEYGILHKTTVRYGVRKQEMTWSELNQPAYQHLYNCVANKEWINLRCYCPETGEIGDRTIYIGDITYNLKEILDDHNCIVTDVKVSFIER